MLVFKKWSIPIDYNSKIIVWFYDGNISTFCSLGRKISHSHFKDIALGLYGFQRKMNSVLTVKIYDLASNNLMTHVESGQMLINLD